MLGRAGSVSGSGPAGAHRASSSVRKRWVDVEELLSRWGTSGAAPAQVETIREVLRQVKQKLREAGVPRASDVLARQIHAVSHWDWRELHQQAVQLPAPWKKLMRRGEQPSPELVAEWVQMCLQPPSPPSSRPPRRAPGGARWLKRAAVVGVVGALAATGWLAWRA